MAAASTVIPLGLLQMRSFQLWLRARGFHPRANPQRQIMVTRQGLHTLSMWFRPRFLTFPPIALLLEVLAKVRQQGSRLLLLAPRWPTRIWFSGTVDSISSPARALEPSCLAPEGDQLRDVSVLEFLQEKLSSDTCPGTLRVYVAAISACHVLIDGVSVGKHPLVARFIRGAKRLRPPTRATVPSWDLAIVLEGLIMTPFEPLESAPIRFLTLKMFFLMAITSLKRIGDLQALSISPSCLDFAPGLVKVILHPHPNYLPKVPFSTMNPVVLEAFCPPPFTTPEQERLHLLCPIRALQIYIHRTSQWRKSEQLFICYVGRNRGAAATKHTVSHWVRDAIALAYEARGQASPLRVRAHSTRGGCIFYGFGKRCPLAASLWCGRLVLSAHIC